MKIKSVKIFGLHKHSEIINLTFNDDLNIITGRNGAGKTTILKLIWYVLSGHIDLAIKEIEFDKLFVCTDIYKCSINKINKNTCKVEWRWENKEKEEVFEDQVEHRSFYYGEDGETIIVDEDDGIIIQNAEEIPNRRLQNTGASVFLPTFRRIEGGFLTDSRPLSRRLSFESFSATASIEEALSNLSDRLTVNNHIFVASLSTFDIESLLIKKHSELSEKYNRIQQKVTSDTMDRIKKSRESNGDAQEDILKLIQKDIEEMEKRRQEIMKPLDTVKESVLKFFKNHRGIKLGKSKVLNFGDAANAINSNFLSAGEKQMLSFLAYNTFYKDAIFIIDEPELSLHVDWQRILLSTLVKQGTSNQFIVATHSPFIYSKYPEKEIQLNPDRGYCDTFELE